MQNVKEIQKKSSPRNYQSVVFCLFPQEISFKELSQLDSPSTLYIIAIGDNPDSYYAYDSLQGLSSFEELHKVDNKAVITIFQKLNSNLKEINDIRRFFIVSDTTKSDSNPSELQALKEKYSYQSRYEHICLVNIPENSKGNNQDIIAKLKNRLEDLENTVFIFVTKFKLNYTSARYGFTSYRHCKYDPNTENFVTIYAQEIAQFDSSTNQYRFIQNPYNFVSNFDGIHNNLIESALYSNPSKIFIDEEPNNLPMLTYVSNQTIDKDLILSFGYPDNIYTYASKINISTAIGSGAILGFNIGFVVGIFLAIFIAPTVTLPFGFLLFGISVAGSAYIGSLLGGILGLTSSLIQDHYKKNQFGKNLDENKDILAPDTEGEIPGISSEKNTQDGINIEEKEPIYYSSHNSLFTPSSQQVAPADSKIQINPSEKIN